MSDPGESFRRFVVARSAALMRLAYLLTADAAAAEDLLQSALVRAYLRWGRIETNPEAYVRRVMITVAADDRRRPWRRERSTARPPETVDLADEFDRTDERDRLRRALQELPPRQRAAVVLRHWLDLSPSDVADHLHCSVGTVRSQTARGLEKLRTAYESDLDTTRESQG